MAASVKPRMSVDEKEWQAEMDVSTVVQYNKIMTDPARKKAMQAKARKMKEGLDKAAGGAK
jgi:hypothetical protein